jgi:hypothetical protein
MQRAPKLVNAQCQPELLRTPGARPDPTGKTVTIIAQVDPMLQVVSQWLPPGILACHLSVRMESPWTALAQLLKLENNRNAIMFKLAWIILKNQAPGSSFKLGSSTITVQAESHRR